MNKEAIAIIAPFTQTILEYIEVVETLSEKNLINIKDNITKHLKNGGGTDIDCVLNQCLDFFKQLREHEDDYICGFPVQELDAPDVLIITDGDDYVTTKAKDFCPYRLHYFSIGDSINEKLLELVKATKGSFLSSNSLEFQNSKSPF